MQTKRTPGVPRPEAYTARVTPLHPRRPADLPPWLAVPMGLLTLVVVLFGGAMWSAVFSRLGLDTSAQQYGSTPFIFGLWFATVLLLGIGLNRIDRWWRARVTRA